jgi:hypothetical protein
MGLNSRESDRSGEWIPTIVGVANFTAATLISAFYTVTGNVVSCSISASIETDAGTVVFTTTLPPDFSRIFSDVGNAAGVVNASFVGLGVVEATDGAATVTVTLQQGATTLDNVIVFSYILD